MSDTKKQRKDRGACRGFDFTIWVDENPDIDKYIEALDGWAKKWVFQLEETKEGKKHLQGRVRLIKETRETTLNSKLKETILRGYWSYTCATEFSNSSFSYVMKEESRIAGPWSDIDRPKFIPDQYKVTLRPWQQQISVSKDNWEPRTINIFYDPKGNIGKSTMSGHLCCQGLARQLPPLRDYKDLMRIVMDVPTAKCYFVDMPRAMKKDKLGEFYAAIETLKGGYAWDDRYSFREKWFNSPVIWIFTNTLPAFDLMASPDRWKIWMLEDNDLLVEKSRSEVEPKIKCTLNGVTTEIDRP